MNRLQVVARRIGNEQTPIVIVDGFHPDADGVRAAGVAATYGPARHLYPGVRADLPANYFQQVRPALLPVLAQVFGSRSGVDLLDASFSMVTADPASLVTEQRLPHVDAVQPGRLALVHYFALDGGEGTAFFRHRATGFEQVNEARSPTYLASLNAEVSAAPPAPAFPFDSNDQFERIAVVEARFNRAVIYPSALLHSGAIAPGAVLDARPAFGRLTVTGFFSAR